MCRLRAVDTAVSALFASCVNLDLLDRRLRAILVQNVVAAQARLPGIDTTFDFQVLTL